ncbi:MAG: pyridoxamine 5'-phosphate oxidase [Pirellula sp.]|jgi:pyridoxamine 5'-phosphate oxidase|nr:pyridoxamine 5'-phosphate oxidase [Pirellula sp.]
MQDLRRNYQFGSLVREQLPAEPMALFRLWWAEVEKAELPEWYEINAMTLSTVLPLDSNSEEFGTGASSRIVLLKGLDEGFCFFTNYDSDKGQQLSQHRRAAIHFFWPFFERQVRVEGIVSKTSAEQSDRYFASRPRSSQLGATCSPQSRVIPDDHDLVDKASALDKQFGEGAIPRPDYWGGYRLTPLRVEFWQGRPSRLHDRFRYRRASLESSDWVLERLAP